MATKSKSVGKRNSPKDAKNSKKTVAKKTNIKPKSSKSDGLKNKEDDVSFTPENDELVAPSSSSVSEVVEATLVSETESVKGNNETGLVIITGNMEEPEILEEVLSDDESQKRDRVLFLSKQLSDSYWDLATLLRDIHDEKLFKKFGHKTWKSYIEKEVDFDVRTSEYFINIVNWAESLPTDGKMWAEQLGWTKAKELTKVVDTSNFTAWMEKTKDKSTSEIINLVKGAEKQNIIDDADSGDPERTEKAIKKNFQLFPAQYKNIEEALSRAKAISESDKDGHALDLICTSYMADNIDVSNIGDYLKRIESALDCKIIALEKDASAIIYGKDTIDMIPDEDPTENYSDDDLLDSHEEFSD